MRKTIFLATIFGMTLVQKSSAQQNLKLSDDSLMKMDMDDFCKTLEIKPGHKKILEAIILPLCDAGIYLFNAQNNEYCYGLDERKSIEGRPAICYCYMSTHIQNEILKRNILKNRKLIVNGVLSAKNALEWKIAK